MTCPRRWREGRDLWIEHVHPADLHYYRLTMTVLSSVKVSIAQRPPTRPTPEREPARPPKGRWLSQWLDEAFMLTQPALTASAKRKPLARSRVKTAESRP